MSVLSITDAGPIEKLTIPVPDGGGVIVLRGRNGVGKTTALNAVGSLLSGKPNVSIRDGATKAEIEGFGATLRLGRRSSRSGELEVVSLEGRLSPADLVDPGLKSEDAADAARIKALLQLTNAEPDVKAFWWLIGGQESFEDACPEDLTSVTDAVALASRVKRAFEATARRREASAENEAGKAAAYRKGTDDVDLTVETDVRKLQSRLESAVSEQTRLTTEARTAEQLTRAADQAQRQLNEIKDSPSSQIDFNTLLDAQQTQVTSLSAAHDFAVDARLEAEKALRDAQHAHELAVLREAEASRAVHAARDRSRELEDEAQRQADQFAQEQRLVQTLRETIATAETVRCPTVNEIEAAAAVVSKARAAIEAAAIARRAQEQLSTAASHEAAAKALVKQASQIRDAAKGTDDVLSAMVAKCGTPLIVKDGRLWLATKRGQTLFAELSHGERWKVAIDVAVNAFRSETDHLPVLTIPQEAYEGLDPSNRAIVSKHAKDSGVVILTAECSDDAAIVAEVA